MCRASLVFVSFLFSYSLFSQDLSKKQLDHADFDIWRTISQPQISNNGHWVTYSLTTERQDPELWVEHIDSGKEIKIVRGIDAKITEDNDWVILLNYNGEPHWPLKRQNRLDFNIRMQQFFDHYLMDQPMPQWMESGVPAAEVGINQYLEPHHTNSNPQPFDQSNDLLLGHFDCKTDVDDLHSVAAFSTLLSHPDYATIDYHAVAGTYGIQKGLYVPANDLFQLAFDNNWTDAHADFDEAVNKVVKIAIGAIERGGDIWIAEAGQSDFSAALVEAIKNRMPELNTQQRIHIVQHSNWNESVTAPEALQFAKSNTDYRKIPDGNTTNNGSPGFNTAEFKYWKSKIRKKETMKLWESAVNIGNRYNGKEGRYLNKSINQGGLDFSDVSETCWILGLDEIRDTEEFFELFVK